MTIDGVIFNGLDIGELTSRMDARDMAEFAQGIDLTLLLSSSWPFIVLAFVVFFYCLGALYDERKDRSVLFWKSLPVSDAQTVLSKVGSAVVVAPVLARSEEHTAELQSLMRISYAVFCWKKKIKKY